MAEAHKRTSSDCSASWIAQVKRTLDPPRKTRKLSKMVCIYRVPKPIKICNPEAYEPMLVSLGPYHCKMNPKPSVMDEHKLKAVHKTLKRLKGKTMSDLISEIQKLDSEIRECYEEAIEWDAETLSWMLAIDACFILDFIRCWVVTKTQSGIKCFISAEEAILNDIMKLENQIPLFLLIKILQLECGNRDEAVFHLSAMLSRLPVFAGYPFSSSLSERDVQLKVKEHIEKGARQSNKSQKTKSACHLLDLSRRIIQDLLTYSSSKSAFDAETQFADDSWYTPKAELLKKAGIKFSTGETRFEKRWLRRSTLFLPQITVTDSTETALRNLMAFEECQKCSWFPEETVISHYVHFLEDLIDSERDVSILKKANIIKSWVGSDEKIANIFNNMGKGLTFGSVKQFEEVGKQASEHYCNRLMGWMNLLRQDYFSNPWYIISFVAAVTLLALTLVQTIYTVKN